MLYRKAIISIIIAMWFRMRIKLFPSTRIRKKKGKTIETIRSSNSSSHQSPNTAKEAKKPNENKNRQRKDETVIHYECVCVCDVQNKTDKLGNAISKKLALQLAAVQQNIDLFSLCLCFKWRCIEMCKRQNNRNSCDGIGTREIERLILFINAK